MQWWPTLAWWQWLVLAGVPPAIIALYFLKLKRRPIEVPSTYLWHRSIEDLHVNSIWQRLRRNLLLVLQLLLISLAALALLRPGWRGGELLGDRFIFLVDNSASMQAVDGRVSRLEEAKRRVGELMDRMESGDVAMVVSFADTARVEHMFDDNRLELKRSVEAIRPTARRTSLEEALKVASGLANPGRRAYSEGDVPAADPLPATLVVASDGKFPPVPDFDPGNLDPEYLPVGNPLAENVGIVAFSVRRHELKPDQLEAYARLENFGPTGAEVDCEIRLDGQLIDADRFRIPPGEAHQVAFPLGALSSGVVHLKITTDDDFSLDNEAWSTVSQPRVARLLVVTPGNRALENALQTPFAATLAHVQLEPPDFLASEAYQRAAELGSYDLLIYDRCRPNRMPQANTFFLAAVPPGDRWKAGEEVEAPEIIDTDPSHPLLQWVAMGDVMIAQGTPLEVPPSGSVLIDSHAGPLLAIAPRAGFEDAVLGFPLIYQRDEPGGERASYFGTNWAWRASFPVFVINLLEYLGGARRDLGGESLQPGDSLALEGPAPDKPLVVRTPSGRTIRLDAPQQGRYPFSDTSELGVYEVRCQGRLVQRFAVNLLDRGESDIAPSTEIHLPVAVAGRTSGWESARNELWKALLLAALAVLAFEWWVYNRRVSV